MKFNPDWLISPEFVVEEIARCRAAVEPGIFETGLIVDSNNVMYRLAFAASKDVSTAADMLEVFLERIKKVRGEVDADVVVCAIDYGVSLRRSMLCATKKSDKTPEQEAVIDLARQALTLLREGGAPAWCNPRWMDGYEADDIAAAFAASRICVHSIIYSTDSDLYQVTDGRDITQLSPDNGRFCVSPVPQYLVSAVKALAGDTSDNIEGVFKVGVKTALAVLTGTKTLDLSPEDTRRVRNNITLTALPFLGSFQVLDGILIPVPSAAADLPPDDDEPLPF